jgi:ankyrin repeat protein
MFHSITMDKSSFYSEEADNLLNMILEGNLFGVKAFIQKNPSSLNYVYSDDNGYIGGPLMVSTFLGNIRMVKILIEGGVSKDHLSSVLAIACVENNFEMAKLLLTHGADPSYKKDLFYGESLILAVNREETTDYIKIANSRVKLVKLLLDYGALPNETECNGRFALGDVVTEEIVCIEMVELLISRGADINWVDNYGIPLIMTITDINAIKLFLDNGIDINVITTFNAIRCVGGDRVEGSNENLLHHCLNRFLDCDFGYEMETELEKAKPLLSRGININITNKLGEAIFDSFISDLYSQIKCLNGSFDKENYCVKLFLRMIQLFLLAGANPNHKNLKGETSKIKMVLITKFLTKEIGNEEFMKWDFALE